MPGVSRWDRPEGQVWWHDTPDHNVRVMFEGSYWVRERKAREKVWEWESGTGRDKPIHEHLGWTAEQYSKWLEDGTLPPPSTTSPWEP